MSDRNQVFRKYAHKSQKWVEVPIHSHTNGQLYYVSQGTLQLRTPNSSWVIPQKRLIWIPPDIDHSVRGGHPSESWKMMVPRAYRKLLPPQVCVLTTSALLIAAMEALPDAGQSGEKEKQKLLIAVIRFELSEAKKESFGTSVPTSPKLAQIGEHLLKHPDDPRTLDEWALSVGMSRQSLIRAFRSEVGISFGAWKRNLILEKALEFLGQGLSVNETADRLGYADPSAFVAAFRKRFGTTPGQFFE